MVSEPEVKVATGLTRRIRTILSFSYYSGILVVIRSPGMIIFSSTTPFTLVFFLFVVGGNEAEHRSENLLLRDPHIVLHVGEYGRWHEVALRQRAFGQPGAAGQRASAFLAADVEIADRKSVV